MTYRTHVLVILVVCLSIFVPAAARAQADPQFPPAAQTLFDQALQELEAKQYDSACRKLEEVTRLVPDGLGAKLALARCYEAQGKLASAWVQIALVEGMASKAGQSDQAQQAAEKAAELKPRLATLTVEVPPDAAAIPGLSITRDGVPIGQAQWGIPLPVDVGLYEIAASAPGRKAWQKPVAVKADGEKVWVVVKPLEKRGQPVRAQPVPQPVREPTKPALQPAAAASQTPWQQPVGIAVMVLGGAGLGAGAVLGGVAILQRDNSNNGHCNAQNQCDPTGLNLRNQGIMLSNAATAAVIAGVAMLGVGITLVVTAPPAASPSAPASRKRGISTRIDMVPGGLQVRGLWQ